MLKARGIKHSNQIREFIITSKGIKIVDVYTGPAGVLTGTARVAQEAKDEVSQILRNQETERKHRELTRKKQMLEAEIALLQSTYESEEDELKKAIDQEVAGEAALVRQQRKMGAIRSSDVTIPDERIRRQ